MRQLRDGGEATPLVTPAAAAAAVGGGAGGTLTSPSAAGSNASFDANMVIILAALLCVLICALGLNSVIRCVLHCGRRLAPSTVARATTATSLHAQQTGLKRKALRKIPVEVYGGASALTATATECAICLGEFADGEKVRVRPPQIRRSSPSAPGRVLLPLLVLPPPAHAHAHLASSSPPEIGIGARPPASAMSPSLLGGLTKSLAMTVLSEVGDKTFFAAAILAMRHPRKLVLAGCLSALTVMTALSASLGWVAPNLISRKWTHHITTLLFFVFGIWSLWEGFKEDGESEDLAEMEAKLDADFKSNKGESKNKSKATDDKKKQKRPFLMQFFSPIFIKAFSITFFGEWGDKSQIATIGLAADENPFGVVIGGVIAQALCTTAAVMGGKSLASQISEKMVELSSGVLFLLFGIMSLLSGPEGQL